MPHNPTLMEPGHIFTAPAFRSSREVHDEQAARRAAVRVAAEHEPDPRLRAVFLAVVDAWDRGDETGTVSDREAERWADAVRVVEQLLIGASAAPGFASVA
jgi:hypothetical protein